VTTPDVSLLVEPTDGMQPIYNLMRSARRSVDLTMYELADPEAVAILDADASRGVEVRVLLDRDYSGFSVNQPAMAQLLAQHVQVRWAYPDTIFHEKALTVDGTAAAIMTFNLTRSYYATTRDFAVVTTDEADVTAIERVFDEDWSATGPPTIGVPADGLVWSPGSTAALVGLIGSARRSLLIENEEMDDRAVESALEAAAERGVAVEVVMTASPEWAAALASLVAHGVEVRTYSRGASLYIHAKVVVADGTSAFVGSENFSAASLDFNRELGLITTARAVVEGVGQTVAADYAGAANFSTSARSVGANDQPAAAALASTWSTLVAPAITEANSSAPSSQAKGSSSRV
jgi:cardiolipin synthase